VIRARGFTRQEVEVLARRFMASPGFTGTTAVFDLEIRKSGDTIIADRQSLQV